MFLVCEPIALGLEHVPFNASLLRVIRHAFPDDRILFFGQESHVREVKIATGQNYADSINWASFDLPPRHSGFFARLSSDFRNVKSVMGRINEKSSRNVLVITGNASILWALKFYACTTHKDKKVQVIIHEDFSKFRYRAALKHHLNPFYHLGSLKTALRISRHQHIQHIVLEESVRTAVVEEVPSLGNRIHVLNHPVNEYEQTVDVNELSLPIEFGFFGRATRRKGFDKYLKVASEISKRFPGLARFHLIGRIVNGNEFTENELSVLSEEPKAVRISRNEYVNRLKKIHFVCLFYDKYYEFFASGVLMDCVAWEKPFISSELPIFKNLHDKFGDIGYLCECNEFTSTISSIVQNNDVRRYQHQVSNIRSVKISRTPEALAVKYRELVDSLQNSDIL